VPDPKDISGGQYPSVRVGSHIMYLDNEGWLHPTPAAAINEDMRKESDVTRGGSGGCNQDPSRAPGGDNR
jgi:hypothetical protein